MSIRGILKLSVLACMVLAVCGCGKPNIIGTDAAVYSAGTLHAVSSQDLNSVYSAAQAAMKQLEIEIAEQKKDVFYAKLNLKREIAPNVVNLNQANTQVNIFMDDDRTEELVKRYFESKCSKVDAGSGGD